MTKTKTDLARAALQMLARLRAWLALWKQALVAEILGATARSEKMDEAPCR